MLLPKSKNVFSRNELLGARGWTDELVDDVLQRPDFIVQYPRAEDMEPQSYFLKDRIQEAEKWPDIAVVVEPRAREWAERRAFRLADKRGRREMAMDAIAVDDIVVEVLPIHRLKILAMEAFYERNAESGRRAPAKLDEATINSICRRYVIGQLVDYAAINAKLPDPLPKADVYKLLGARIDAAVLRAYPDLAAPDKAAAPESQGATADSSSQ